MGRRKWPFMLNWGCGDYITSVQWVQGGSEVNQSPGITTPWSDSTQNSSVNGYSAAPGHISHRSEEGRTEMWPLRAAGLVNGLWRCDERLLWHLFALGPSCLGQCVCRCGVSFLLFFRVGWIVSGRCPHYFLSFLLSSSFGWSTVLGEGGIDNFVYGRFQRTCSYRRRVSIAGAVAPQRPQVQAACCLAWCLAVAACWRFLAP